MSCTPDSGESFNFVRMLYEHIQSIASDTRSVKDEQKIEDILTLEYLLSMVALNSMIPFFEKPPFIGSAIGDFPCDTKLALIDIDLSDGDVDISAWNPIGLLNNAIVRIRKIDDSTNKLIWNDSLISKTYNFIDRKGEYISLIWDSSVQKFKIY